MKKILKRAPNGLIYPTMKRFLNNFMAFRETAVANGMYTEWSITNSVSPYLYILI